MLETLVNPLVKRMGVSKKQSSALYQGPPSLIDHLPWVEVLEDGETILLDDGKSVGAVFEIEPRGTEGRSEEFLVEIRERIADLIQNTFVEHDRCPWVIQTFTFSDKDLSDFAQGLRDYMQPQARDTEFSAEYARIIARHYEGVCKPGGLFEDTTVTGVPWGGTRLRNYLFLYRRLGANYKNNEHDDGLNPVEALNETCMKLIDTLRPSGIRSRRVPGAEFHHWMTRWFNQCSDLDEAGGEKFHRQVNFSADEAMPFGNEFTESMFYTMPRSDQENRCWHFGNAVSRCITVEGLRRRPVVGHATGEISRGDCVNTMMDQFPESTVMVATVVAIPPDVVEGHIDLIEQSAIGDSVDAMRTKEDCDTAKRIIGNRQKLYRASYAFYVTAPDVPTLNRYSSEVRSIAVANGLRAIAVKDDVMALDAYLRNLPMVYDAELDRMRGWRVAKLTWVQHIANLSCLFGRATGTGHPGILNFNRGGAPLVFDPLNKADRVKNAHMLLIGPTGAGKSASLTSILSNVMALYRPRMFIIEAGNSFGLLVDWYASLGITTNVVSMKPGSAIALPTFRDAKMLLGTPAELADLDQDAFGVNEDADDAEDVQRDPLGEMEAIATLMITGGEEKEAELLRRADRYTIRKAIIRAAQNTQQLGVECLTEHVVQALNELAEDATLEALARQKIRDMASAMALFCDGFNGEVFNRPGGEWPEVDVTLVDLAYFAREGYEAHLAISVISTLNMINNRAERDQHDKRGYVVAIDEAHVLTTNPLLAPFLTKIVKMWRKLGAWLWLATQNMEDFPGAAKKLLNSIEWWICLVMPREEVDAISRFKDLSEEQRRMLRSATKADRKFTEGVVLATGTPLLFRSVPPSTILSLAMTEKEEKTQRAELMREHGVSEVQAALLVADEIDRARGLAV